NVVISFGEENKFYKEVMESGSNKSLVQEAVNKVMGVDLNIKFVVREDLDGTKETKEAQVEKKMKSSEEMKPVIEKAMDVFGGHVVRDMMEDN
ncbi:MAG: hypothetical protein KAI70_07215, partial [Candidatus Omnitrophica bacterium]|nr:hypothetical protein [Candidatus Omnitrophota bacterium]